MKKLAYLVGLAVILAVGCSGGKFDKLPDASASDRSGAEALWGQYLKILTDPETPKDALRVAPLFSKAVLVQTSEGDFEKRINTALKKRSVFDTVKIKALKNDPSGLLLVVDSKAGEAGIPVVKEGDSVKFAELMASTGDWTVEVKPLLAPTSGEASLLFTKMVLRDESAPIGDRLKVAVGLAAGHHRDVIVSSQKTVSNPIVRLGLGLARIKLDGSDESFLRNFPTDATGLTALAQADRAIFEEMIGKLGNLGAMVEEPPANEVLYRVAGGAPAEMRQLMGQALYTMAELGPIRFANAVKNVSKDIANDPVLGIYLDEVKRKEGKAPQLTAFLNKFASQGESEERQLCQAILSRINKAR